RGRLLLRRMIKDGRAVLGAFVGALAIHGCRVVEGEEELQQLAVGNHRGVELHLNDLGVSCRPRTDLAIRGSGPGTTRIARCHLPEAAKLLEAGLEAPETPAGQRCDLFRRVPHVLPSSRAK